MKEQQKNVQMLVFFTPWQPSNYSTMVFRYVESIAVIKLSFSLKIIENIHSPPGADIKYVQISCLNSSHQY